jgi:hypothetical protein
MHFRNYSTILEFDLSQFCTQATSNCHPHLRTRVNKSCEVTKVRCYETRSDCQRALPYQFVSRALRLSVLLCKKYQFCFCSFRHRAYENLGDIYLAKINIIACPRRGLRTSSSLFRSILPWWHLTTRGLLPFLTALLISLPFAFWIY